MNYNNIFGLVGTGGHGRESIEQVKHPLTHESITINQKDIFFIELKKNVKLINGYKVIEEAKFLDLPNPNKFFNISIADHKIRKKLAENFIDNGCQSIALISSLASIGSDNRISEGAIISQFATITSNIEIGKFFHLNRYASISHDCIIGDYVTFAPYATASGNVNIHDGAYVGTGAIIKQGSSFKPIIIGKNAIIGMGAIVTKDVPENSTVVGNPARIMHQG